jgi:hypothetical protein
MPRYKVLVDDNFHYQDQDERYEDGIYDTLAEALAACRKIVDRSLTADYRPGIAAERLYERYTSFGEDPFIDVIEGQDESAKFSAWDYAKERCRALCGGA